MKAAAQAAGRTDVPRIQVAFRPIIAPDRGAGLGEGAPHASSAIEARKAGGALDPAPRASSEPGEHRLAAAARASPTRGDRFDRALWTPTAAATGGAGNSNALVGTPETVAQALLDYYDLGVDILSARGYDLLDDAIDFGRHVIPIVREEVAKRDAERASRDSSVPDSPGGERMTSASSAPELTVIQVPVFDPRVEPLLRELGDEYSKRYGRDAHAEISPALPRRGVHPAARRAAPAAAGTRRARRRWRLPPVRRGHGRAETDLDPLRPPPPRPRPARRRRAGARRRRAGGSRRVYLTTEPRQPEARGLYLATGYTPLFDTGADPETIGPLPFEKHLGEAPKQ